MASANFLENRDMGHYCFLLNIFYNVSNKNFKLENASMFDCRFQVKAARKHGLYMAPTLLEGDGGKSAL